MVTVTHLEAPFKVLKNYKLKSTNSYWKITFSRLAWVNCDSWIQKEWIYRPTFWILSTPLYDNVAMPPVVLSPLLSIYFLQHIDQEAHLSPRDRAMRRVSWNLASCHATVQKLLVRQVLNKSKLWSWRVTVARCVINTCTQPWRDRVAFIVL